MIKYLEIMIPLLAALVTAIWGYKKFLDERDFNSYQENVKNLFSEDKEIQLGAITTLGFYKNKKKYNIDIIEILLNRFYTELDYDVINAIISELSQVSTSDEMIYITQKLLDINRNFAVQRSAIRDRGGSIKDAYGKSEVLYFEQLKKTDNLDDEIISQHKKHLVEKIGEIQIYDDWSNYKLAWHQQIVSDALAMTLLHANRRGITSDIELNFYGNSIVFSQFYDIAIGQWLIRFSDFTSSSLQEVSSSRVSIFSTFFEKSLIRRSNFKEGTIGNVEFVDTKLDTVTFENIQFEDVYFIGVELNNCKFKNTPGLNPLLFYNCKITDLCLFDENFDESMINSITKEELITELQNSSRSLYGKSYIKQAIESQDTREQS